MANKKHVVKLSNEERERLGALISKGKAAAKTILKARILLEADASEAGEGWTDARICEALDTNVNMVMRVRAKLVEEGLDAVLRRKKRETPPVAPIFDGAKQALFQRGPRKVPLIGKVIGVGMVDEITDRTWVVVDAVDGRVHYADLGRIEPGDAPHRGMLVALAGDATLRGKPTSVPRLEVLSEVQIGRLASYDGPTWLDEAIIGKLQVQNELPGFPAELGRALADRGRWLAGRGLAEVSGSNEVAPKPDMMRSLRQLETAHLAETLSRQLNAIHMPREPGARISGVYERAIVTPTGKLAIIRSADTFTLAPWKPALEPLRGRAVLGLVGPNRVMCTLDRGRTLPGRG